MRKFFNLVINEYVKVFSKTSTKIMLAVIILLALGYNAISYYDSSQVRRWSTGYVASTEDYNRMISDAKREKSEGWETEVEKLEFARDNGINLYDYSWQSNAISSFSTTKQTMNEATDEEEKAEFDKQKDIILRGDWKAYLAGEIAKVGTAITDPEELERETWANNYRIVNNIEPKSYGKDWKSDIVLQIEGARSFVFEQMKKPIQDRDKKRLDENNEAILIGMYRLENNINAATVSENISFVGSDSDFLKTFTKSAMLLMVVSLLIIIVAGGSMSSEFSNGTVKFLLVNPVKRGKILAAKYISVLSVALIMLITFYVFNALLAGIFCGFGDIGASHLYVSEGAVHSIPSILNVAWKYIVGSLNLLAMATFAFALSSLVRSSALSIGLGVFLFTSGTFFVQVFARNFKMDWARYIIFANTDLNMIQTYETPFINHTVRFALVVVAVYMAVFLLTAWDGFVRRDVR